ncbi:uncharacterized protein A4U43_C07F25170 [Asparagus officinalis]|uniref:Uncharacterized protein n=1 Tax=Asparagus officinalis TaxID=4686 RepID=A0A5P1EGP9_ASPOF|nr:uncharacterized protein A4U43_C07F25170 [Asparagus officinalis]
MDSRLLLSRAAYPQLTAAGRAGSIPDAAGRQTSRTHRAAQTSSVPPSPQSRQRQPCLCGDSPFRPEPPRPSYRSRVPSLLILALALSLSAHSLTHRVAHPSPPILRRAAKRCSAEHRPRFLLQPPPDPPPLSPSRTPCHHLLFNLPNSNPDHVDSTTPSTPNSVTLSPAHRTAPMTCPSQSPSSEPDLSSHLVLSCLTIFPPIAVLFPLFVFSITIHRGSDTPHSFIPVIPASAGSSPSFI